MSDIEKMLTLDNINNIFLFVKEYYNEKTYEDCVIFFEVNTGTGIFDIAIGESLGDDFFNEYQKKRPCGGWDIQDEYEHEIGKLIIKKAKEFKIIN